MSQWQPFESPQLDDMVAWDWMKSPKTILNNDFTLFYCVKKYKLWVLKCAERYSIFIGLFSNLFKC
jgi:hypothetical protein